MAPPLPEPTREGVEFPSGLHYGHDGLITIPDKRKRTSEIRYRAAYDEDKMVIFERTAQGHLCSARVRGPLSARAWIRSALHGMRLRGDRELPVYAIFWEADAPQRGEPGSPEEQRHTELVRALSSFPSAQMP